ncbi:PEP-CTERM sorting domain-containing protein [Thalassomonas haliotis]|uniref:PEP-CTERM sorting domain-containing protein n=1 Tax=Thalassomonas haliotis TaxID=485448 RepID=A0ABY7VL93_9GAMM|nr:PEP-CTERM sorting domain-containing protein [Thalassomonas haliotis]WDE13452.1 PEP-CTERM sorting domain-containing protein [Thalassomonas haliotis]
MKKLISLVLTITVLLWGASASASLMGDEVFLTCMQSSGSDHELCEGNGALPAIVGADVEYPDYFNFENSLSIDINANSIWVTFDNGPFCGWFTCDGQGLLEFWLTDLHWVDMPGGIITGLDVITNMTGIQTGYDDHSVHFALPETSVDSSMFLHINLLTDHEADVPEPGTLILFALTLTGLVCNRRKKSIIAK